LRHHADPRLDQSRQLAFGPHRQLALAKLLLRMPFLPLAQREFIFQAMAQRIRFASATKLPFRNRSVEVIYSSHMMETCTVPTPLYFCRKRAGCLPQTA
jgi:hypothetical protein